MIIGDADRDRAVTMVEEQIRMRRELGELPDGTSRWRPARKWPELRDSRLSGIKPPFRGAGR
jgi:hypothetical protein